MKSLFLTTALFLSLLPLTLNLGFSQPKALNAFPNKDTVTPAETTKFRVKDKYYKSPGRAMLLSTILPGTGQFYTENYLKGAIITATWGTLSFLVAREHLRARNALTINDTNTYLQHRDQRNNLLWWDAAVWVFSIADAYVSSHMYKFKEQETLTQKINYQLEIESRSALSLKLKILL